MNGVLGMTELLLETGLTATQRKYAETVQRSGKNLLGIINDMLDFSKIEAGQARARERRHGPAPHDRGRGGTACRARPQQGAGTRLQHSGRLVTTHVKGDPLRLGQVLTNLVGNAIKFTERGRS